MTPEELALKIRTLLLLKDNLPDAQAARLIGMTQQNFSEKLKKGTLRYNEVDALVNALGYEIVWRPKENE